MTQEGKDKIITRAIHFIATNTNDKSYRIGQAIIAELDLVKKLTIPVVGITEEQLKAIKEMKLESTQPYALGNDDAIRKVLRLFN